MKPEDITNLDKLQSYLCHIVPGLWDACKEQRYYDAVLILWHWWMLHMTYPGPGALVESTDPLVLIRALLGLRGGVWCSGAAQVFAESLRAIHVPSCVYGYGYDDGVSHVTTLFALPKSKGSNELPPLEFYILDAYLGYYYVLPGKGGWLPFLDLLRLVKAGEYGRIDVRITPIPRPYVIPTGQFPKDHRFLWLDGIVPTPEKRGGWDVYSGAIYTWEKMLGVSAEGAPSTMRQFIDRRRGNVPLDQFLLDLMLINPVFGRVAPDVTRFRAEFEMLQKMITLFAGGHT